MKRRRAGTRQEKGGDGMAAPKRRGISCPEKLEETGKELDLLYQTFERTTAPFIAQASCGPGCADCCTNVGEICATTLEALRIMTYMDGLPILQGAVLRQKIAENRALKRQHLLLPCPFLNSEKLCTIYPVRPFSCRRLYSLEPCGSRAPWCIESSGPWRNSSRERSRLWILWDIPAM